MRCNILHKYSASRFSELFDIQHGLFEYMPYAYSNIQIRPQIVSVDNFHVLVGCSSDLVVDNWIKLPRMLKSPPPAEIEPPDCILTFPENPLLSPDDNMYDS